MSKNKVRYNLKNSHYAVETITDGVVSYGTPVPVPGSVSLDLAAQGELTEFYADGFAYFVSSTNDGYSGDFIGALLPDSFFIDVMGDEKSETTGVLFENSDAKVKRFAWLFEFDGDVNNIPYAIYGITATRPNITGKTKEKSTTPTTETMPMRSTPISHNGKNYTRAKCTDETPQAVRDAWYSKVHMPGDVLPTP